MSATQSPKKEAFTFSVPVSTLKQRRSTTEGRVIGQKRKTQDRQEGRREKRRIERGDGGEMMKAGGRWIVYAVASGACAAFNGVFAKLTTNELTTHLSGSISKFLGLEGADRVLEVVVRCMFFGLNLVFNGVMWTLFTKALKKGKSTTQVSIMNTSTNFMITALSGFVIFAESLPPLWWLGAALLVVGNVIIGRNRVEEDVDEHEEGEAPLIKSGDDDDGEDELVPLLEEQDSGREDEVR